MIVNMSELKLRAVRFPEPVRFLILSERETMDLSDFITKIGTWEKLLQMHQEATEK